MRIALCLALMGTALSSSLLADTIVFKNGDKLTGKIVTLDSGKLKLTGTIAGDVSVDLKDVATFSSDAPLKITTKDGNEEVNQPVSSAADNTVKAATGQTIALDNIKKLNPVPEKWTGSMVLNGMIARGNTDTDDLGFSLTAIYRRQNDRDNDRTTLNGAYNFGRQRDPGTGDSSTSTDNWMAEGKYDRFWTEKLYGYADLTGEHDRIANLNIRVTPGVGIGYQWVEKPELKFNTEAGVAYVYEDYTTNGDDEHAAFRLAYHLEKKLTGSTNFFHNFEVYPTIDDPSDYTMTTDAGVHVKITQNWFTEIKAELQRDSTPAEGAVKNDLRYTIGLGWNF